MFALRANQDLYPAAVDPTALDTNKEVLCDNYLTGAHTKELRRTLERQSLNQGEGFCVRAFEIELCHSALASVWRMDAVARERERRGVGCSEQWTHAHRGCFWKACLIVCAHACLCVPPRERGTGDFNYDLEQLVTKVEARSHDGHAFDATPPRGFF